MCPGRLGQRVGATKKWSERARGGHLEEFGQRFGKHVGAADAVDQPEPDD